MPFTQSSSPIYYQVSGQGMPLLIINGFGPPCEWMQEMYAKHFLDRFHCVVADLRGVGQSAPVADSNALTLEDFAQDHLAVMDALGWESAHVYGGSMGASISATLALIAPERVRSLALGSLDCGNPNIYCQPYRSVVETRIVYGRSILAQSSAPEQAAQVMLDFYFGPEPTPRQAAYREFVVNMFKQHPMQTNFPPLQGLAGLPDDLSELLNALPPSAEPTRASELPRPDFVTGNLWERLSSIVVDTLLVHGLRDPIIPYQSALYAAQQIPGAELRLIHGMYHSLSGRPDLLADIGDWMQHTSRSIA